MRLLSFDHGRALVATCRGVPASVNTSIMAGLVVNVPGSVASVRA